MCRKGVSENSAFFAANYSATCVLPQCRKSFTPQWFISKRDGLLPVRLTRELEEDIFQAVDLALH
jgi:hypothetical protein